MFGKRLRQIRMEKGITQQATADAIGSQLRSYQRYEGGHCDPPLNTLVAIADFFDISLDYLLCRDEFIKSHAASADEC